MDPLPTNPGEGLGPLKRISTSLLALIRGRFELFTVEWQEERLRLLNLLLWLGLAATIGATGVFIGMMALAFWLWATAGYAGLVGLAVLALLVAWIMLRNLRQKIIMGPLPFAQTLAEFKKDGECLQSHN